MPVTLNTRDGRPARVADHPSSNSNPTNPASATAALAHWRASRPTTSEEEEAFVREHCPLIVEGVANLARYLEQVRAGKRPKHVA